METRVKRDRKVVPIVPARPQPKDDEELDGRHVADETEVDQCEKIVRKYAEKANSPSKAIRAFCVACMGGYVREVNRCETTSCVLHPFRFGTNPFHGRVGQPAPKKKK